MPDRALPLGFLLATLVWIAAYVARLPEVHLDSRVLLALLLTIMALGAATIGWRTRSVAIPAGSALVAGLVNCLLIASAVHTRAAEQPGVVRVTLSDWAWIPGSLAATAVVGLVFGLAGCALRSSATQRPSVRPESTERSQSVLAVVVVFTTLVLMSVGSLVTSREAGLAVPDWPTSYGYNMFLFPFTKMVGGIYYEHAHRLIGSLVGLQTLVLCLWMWRKPPRVAPALSLAAGRCPNCSYATAGLTRRRCPECGFTWSADEEESGPVMRLASLIPDFAQRRPIPWLGAAVLALVIIQGVLGGQRVTMVNLLGHTFADVLAVFHAFTAQVFLLAAALLAFLLRRAARRQDHHSAEIRCEAAMTKGVRTTAIRLAIALLVLGFGQTIFGALTRHFGFDWALLLHVLGALAVVAAALALASIIMMHVAARPLRLAGPGLIATVVIQVLLGAVSWWMTTRLDRLDQVLDLGVSAVVSAHVVVGAILLLETWLITMSLLSTGESAESANREPIDASKIRLLSGATPRGLNVSRGGAA